MVAKRILAISSVLLSAGFFCGVIQVRAASESLYTADQAKRGATLYAAQCASCHGDDLAGIGQNPPLTGDEFLSKYEGQPLAILFDTIQNTMPATHPGSLGRQQTADVLSYILSSNKYLAGEKELPSDAEDLKKIQLEKPPK